ncbi:hypothetical protein [Streptomyces sp. C]|uniref:hypothetical protein n=1 Tax=Streptomyces sp. C TaxID=253839 RepID=UPI0001B5092E|nr:hypothetical protein [Streptomyces sp. C]EFL20032.1 predicted protein [Streptomyces sp. C]
MLEKASRKNAEATITPATDLSDGGASPAEESTDLGAIPAQIQVQEPPTVAIARERLVEAIGREAAFLADQRAGQASEGLETLARAFALATGRPASVATDALVTAAGTVAEPVSSRGVFAHGFDRPSPIQPTAVAPVVE